MRSRKTGTPEGRAPGSLKTKCLLSLTVLPLIVVFEDGRLLHIRSFDRSGDRYLLRLEPHGRIDVPAARVEAIVDEAPSSDPLPALAPAISLKPYHDRFADVVVPYGKDLARLAREHDLDPLLLYCIMQVESAGNPRALSPKGAMGLMQLMPGTARRFSVEDPWDPLQNIGGACRYLNYLHGLFGGKVDLILAAYNCGEVLVQKYGGVPEFRETRNYVRKIIELYRTKSKPA